MKQHPLLLAFPAIVLVVVLGVVLVFRAGPKPLTVASLQAYENAITPSLRSGGETVQLGIKPAIDDIVNKHIVPPAAIGREAAAWVETLVTVRNTLSHVRAPQDLKGAAHDFDVALSHYVEAATMFQLAAQAPPSARRALLAKSYAAGTAGDKTYDAASAIIQQWRKKLGLPPSTFFTSN